MVAIINDDLNKSLTGLDNQMMMKLAKENKKLKAENEMLKMTLKNLTEQPYDFSITDSTDK